MKPSKKLIPLLILLTILLGAFAPMFAGVAEAAASDIIFDPVAFLSGAIGFIGAILMRIAALALIFTGLLFDGLLQFTVVDMAKHLNDPTGVAKGINEAWSTLRDLANMVFIFVLLWAAIKLILGLGDDIGKTIRSIVIVGLLINFSLFFTKVVIDASNIPTIGFYNSIIAAGNTQPVQGIPSWLFGGTQIGGFTSIFMKAVGIHSFFGSDILKGFSGGSTEFAVNTFITTGLGTVTMLVMAIIFLVASVLFTARFILLIFLLILSPIALVGYALPALSGRFKEWWDAVVSQAFFAPFFMVLIWVAIRITTSLNLTQVPQQWAGAALQPASVLGLILNYTLVIGFLVTALVLSKKMASKAPGFSAISGMVGTGAIGGAALIGRQTIGRYANKVASDKDLQERAARGDIGARMKLATAQKTASSSFDVRGIADSKVGKAVGAGTLLGGIGGTTGAGGFAGAKQAKTDKKRKELDEIMRRFRDKPEIIAAHLMRQKASDQEYMYDKLSARDRAALEEKLDLITGGTAVKDRLRNRLSDDEKEKTDKAAKDAARDKTNKDIRIQIENLVAGRPAIIPGSVTPATPAGTPATYDDLLLGRNALRVTDARKLSREALNEDDVIRRLSPRHLQDIIANKDDLDAATIAYIPSLIIHGAPYPMQAQQEHYINSDAARVLWGI